MKADCSRVCGKPSAAMPASARAACQMAGGVGEGEGAAWIDGGDGEARCGSSRVASRDFHGVVDKPLHDSRSTWLPHERAISACLSRHSSALATRCSKRIPLSRACCRHAPCTWKAQGHVVVAAIDGQAARQDSGARTAHDVRGMKLDVICLRLHAAKRRLALGPTCAKSTKSTPPTSLSAPSSRGATDLRAELRYAHNDNVAEHPQHAHTARPASVNPVLSCSTIDDVVCEKLGLRSPHGGDGDHASAAGNGGRERQHVHLSRANPSPPTRGRHRKRSVAMRLDSRHAFFSSDHLRRDAPLLAATAAQASAQARAEAAHARADAVKIAAHAADHEPVQPQDTHEGRISGGV